MNYIIPKLNGQTEIISPKLEVVGLSEGNPKIYNIDFITLQYSIDIILEVDNARFGLTLNNVQAESLNWENAGANIQSQVLVALNEQFGV